MRVTAVWTLGTGVEADETGTGGTAASVRPGTPPRLRRRPALLGLQEADAYGLFPDDGAPKGYRPASDEKARVMAGVRELLFPLRPWREGGVFDGFVSNLAADRFPLELLTVPTLVISARDDPLARYQFAAKAASRIPGARLVTIGRGGHLFIGHDAVVRKEISTFVASAGPTSA
jgi:pimeloyl-ACP methyl ester carboxylesterase